MFDVKPHSDELKQAEFDNNVPIDIINPQNKAWTIYRAKTILVELSLNKQCSFQLYIHTSITFNVIFKVSGLTLKKCFSYSANRTYIPLKSIT